MASKAAQQTDSSTTVKFNVGGRFYEISKSLLARFPDTVLAKKAKSASSPIFIDRDSDRFAFCLDYMRDNGKVYLPETISKMALLEELRLLGFGIDETKILSDRKSQHCITSSFHQILKSSRERVVQMEDELEMEKVALKCFETSLANTASSFYVNYQNAKVPWVHTRPYFIERCHDFALLIVTEHCSNLSVRVTRKTD